MTFYVQTVCERHTHYKVMLSVYMYVGMCVCVCASVSCTIHDKEENHMTVSS